MEKRNGISKPETIKLNCKECSFSGFINLSKHEIERQKIISEQKTKYWYPKDKIESYRKTNVDSYFELFTKRNLSALSELNNAIEQVEIEECRDFLHYVFTGMMYSCSKMQMYSDKYPSSSRGWIAPRFYLPPISQEKNVWKSFNARFNNVIKCKIKLNSILPKIQIAENIESFYKDNKDVFIYQSDFHEINLDHKALIKHIYIDPPYIDDIDYIGFSKFWGSWLRMKFDPIIGLHHAKASNCEVTTEALFELFYRIRREVANDPLITIAFGAKKQKAWYCLCEAIIKADYEIDQNKITPIIWDNTYKRGGSLSQSDFYITLNKKNGMTRSQIQIKEIVNRLINVTSSKPNEIYKNQESKKTREKKENKDALPKDVKYYTRSALYIKDKKKVSSVDYVRTITDKLVPKNLSSKLKYINEKNIKYLVKQNNLNRRAYHTLCFDILNIILSKDNLNVTNFENSVFYENNKLTKAPQPEGVFKGAAFIAQKDNLKIAFCFNDQSKASLKNISKRIKNEDKLNFKIIYVLIVKTQTELINCRKYGNAEQWPRGFFISFAEIIKRAREIDNEKVEQITSFNDVPTEKTKNVTGGKVREFWAKVDNNIPVGSVDEDASHFKLVLDAPELMGITPGQFVMLDTMMGRISNGETNTTSWARMSEDKLQERILTRSSFLKRPFGIHRASYEHFNNGYLKTLALPPYIASITHTVFPHRFEIFYKVLKYGIGTNELRNVTKGTKVRVLGPLGKKIQLAELREKGIEEVHLIGGGVGMAPLIYLGQALKYYSFRIKAFIGIDSFETLSYRDHLATSMGENAKEAYIYIDDLENIGLTRDDIYVSYDNDKQVKYDKIDDSHRYFGFVTNQYKEYLEHLNETKNILAFSCGPMPMMKRLNTIIKDYKIPLRVFLEKRMACGIGVCLSCVCRNKDNNNNEKYVRVCKDGPLFNAEDIVWD